MRANTTADSMRYCYGTSDTDTAQRLLLLQAIACLHFLALRQR